MLSTKEIFEVEDSKSRNNIGKVIFSEKENYTTSIAGDKMFGWVKSSWKEDISAGDNLVVFHRESSFKFFVKVEKIQNYPISAGGFEKKISEIGTYLHLTPLLEIDPEQEYAGPPRPHNLSGFELDIPNPKELGLMFNIPSDGLPLGHINEEKTTPFFYPLVPEDTRFQSWLIAGVQGKGKSIFAKLLIQSLTSKTTDSVVILDREGEYQNFTSPSEMTDEGKKFFSKNEIKNTKPRVLKLSDDFFESTATLSINSINMTDILQLMPELQGKSSEVAQTIIEKSLMTLHEKELEKTWMNLRREIIEELNTSQLLSGVAGAQIKGAIERAISSHNLNLFDQKGKTLLTPENIFNEKTVTIIDCQTLQPARQRMVALYLLLMVNKYKLHGNMNNEQGVLVVMDEAEFLFPKSPGNNEKDYVHRIEEMIKDPVRRGRKHHFGLILITHEINDLSRAVTNLCNTKVIFGSSLVGNKLWFNENLGKQFANEVGSLLPGQCIINTEKTSIPINVKLHVPFIGNKEDFFGE